MVTWELELTIAYSKNSLQVARLNLMAGESSIKTSSFHSAVDYFTAGIKLLPAECWKFEYDLTAKLHDAAQDAVFATGDFPKLSLFISKVITNAKNFDDKLNSCEWVVHENLSEPALFHLSLLTSLTCFINRQEPHTLFSITGATRSGNVEKQKHTT